MNFFSPDRRRIAGRPAYASGVAVLPHLVIDPCEDGSWTVAVIGVAADRGACWFHQEIRGPENLIAFLESWRADPEAALAALGWQKPRLQEPASAPQGLTLEDLEE